MSDLSGRDPAWVKAELRRRIDAMTPAELRAFLKRLSVVLDEPAPLYAPMTCAICGVELRFAPNEQTHHCAPQATSTASPAPAKEKP